MPFSASKTIAMTGPKMPAIQGLLVLRGVRGAISSLSFNENSKAYKVGVKGADGHVSYHTLAVSDVEEVERPRLGVLTSQRN
jgi:hypothetical protein